MGITAFTWLAVKLRVATLPVGVNMHHVSGLALVAGVGFTVALFVTGLAFDAENLQTQAKIGILGASLVAGILGLAALALATRPAERRPIDDDGDVTGETARPPEADEGRRTRRAKRVAAGV